MTCALRSGPVGTYALRLSFDGRVVLSERCETPHHALARSLEAFGTLLARAWREDAAIN
jgi:hypothetical protein